MVKKTLVLAAAIIVSSSFAQARDQIKIVGSSTVYPFSTTVAEKFGKTTSFKTPVVESTGSGGGLKLLCAGIGVKHPDILMPHAGSRKEKYRDALKTGSKILLR